MPKKIQGKCVAGLEAGGFAGPGDAEGQSEETSDQSGRLGDFTFKGVLKDSVLVDPGEVSGDASEASHFSEGAFEGGVDINCSSAGEGGRGAG